jgi:site-specific DNA-methyltransferase (cytosine-N4-specific)
MLTDEGDVVADIFGGSCGTGEVCERLKRNWTCIDLDEGYLLGGVGHFQENPNPRRPRDPKDQNSSYRIFRPDVCWNGASTDKLPSDGGRRRKTKKP